MLIAINHEQSRFKSLPGQQLLSLLVYCLMKKSNRIIEDLYVITDSDR